MINTSNEYKEKINLSRKFLTYLEITLQNGTILECGNERVMDIKIDDSVGANKFEIGSAVINKATIVLKNSDRMLNTIDFIDAKISIRIGLQLSESVEILNKGIFYVDEAKTTGNNVFITAYDSMYKFDEDYEPGISYPASLLTILQDICTRRGVYLATSSFTNWDYVVESKAEDTVTDREMIAYISQISGCFARINTNDALELKWYDMDAFESEENIDGGGFDYTNTDNVDGGNFEDYETGDIADGGTFLTTKRYHHFYRLYTSDISTDEYAVTGIQVKDNQEEQTVVLFGSTGYIFEISNPLIQNATQANIVANTVGQKIVGMALRPYTITMLNDPSIEAGDIAKISDNKGNTYNVYVAAVNFTLLNKQTIRLDAETPKRKQSTKYDAITKAIIEERKETDKLFTNYDISMQQLTNLITNGFGLFKTETVDSNGGTIYYMHDQPTMDESLYRWFMTSGGMIEQKKISGVWTTVAAVDNEGNALFNVITARGLNADWVRTGKLQSVDNSVVIDLDNGNFTFSDSNGQALITPNGVANSDNFQAADNIANDYPLKMPFNIDDSVSIITSVKLKWTIDKFRTYSKGSSSGGGTSTTSDNATSWAETNATPLSKAGYTNEALGPGNHSHYFAIDATHSHVVSSSPHSHGVYVPSHSHGVSYGILESNVTDTIIKVLVDGIERAAPTTAQGEIDLSQWITTPGWHAIEIASATLKRVSAQVNIKSYIRR